MKLRNVGIVTKLIDGTLIAMFCYHFYVAFTGLPEPLDIRSTHVSFILFLGFLHYRLSSNDKSTDIPWYDCLLALAGLTSAVFIHVNYEAISFRMPYFDPLTTGEWIVGCLTIVLVLELTRRSIGFTLPLLVILAIVHSVFGPYFPSILNHPGIPFQNVIDHLFLTSNGLYGSLTSLSLAEIFMFIAFGAMIQVAGGEQLFTQVAEGLTKNLIGGPAKSAVIGSSLFGCVSGSGAANVYATGVVTIPMMVRAGFRPIFAASVEACSSTLGQLIPPVMGASAFLIAEFSHKPYLDVAYSAIVPSIIYIYAIYFAVHQEAKKQGIGVIKGAENIPSIKQTLLDYGHLLLPVVVLVYFLGTHRTAYYAATMATISIVVVSFFRVSTRLSVAKLYHGVRDTIWRLVSIASTLFCAGLTVGVLQTTGVPFRISSFIIQLAQGNLLATCVLVAITAIILGMGLPVSGAFLIASLFGAPAMIELGVDPFVAYMFIFMFSMTSMITPPVCIATFAAASIAGTPFMRTGIQSVKLGLSAYIIPFMVVYNPTLLDIFDKGLVFGIQSFVSTILGVTAFVAGVANILVYKLNSVQRLLLIVGGLALIWPGTISDILGLGSLTIVYLWQRYSPEKVTTM
jgi:TRAP transporter 4TM/12TM fusion protein